MFELWNHLRRGIKEPHATCSPSSVNDKVVCEDSDLLAEFWSATKYLLHVVAGLPTPIAAVEVAASLVAGVLTCLGTPSAPSARAKALPRSIRNFARAWSRSRMVRPLVLRMRLKMGVDTTTPKDFSPSWARQQLPEKGEEWSTRMCRLFFDMPVDNFCTMNLKRLNIDIAINFAISEVVSANRFEYYERTGERKHKYLRRTNSHRSPAFSLRHSYYHETNANCATSVATIPRSYTYIILLLYFKILLQSVENWAQFWAHIVGRRPKTSFVQAIYQRFFSWDNL
jgi:hypothetical protein